MHPQEAGTLCQDAIRNAERLDAGNTRTHVAQALYHLFFSWDFSECDHHLQLALKNPEQENFLLLNSVYHTSGIYQIVKHDLNQAIALLRKALKLDPLNLAIHMELTRAFLYNREYKKALEGINTIIRTRPDYLPAYERKGWILFTMGQQREGIEAFNHYRKHSSFPAAGLAGLAYAHARTMESSKASESKDLIMTVSHDIPILTHLDLAIAHLGAQEYDEMFVQLHLAAKEKMPSLIFLESDPLWDEIRRFNEYEKLRKKIFN